MTAEAAVPSTPRPTERRSLSFSIGHVAGIDIRVHLTFFLLVALFALGSSGPGGPGVVGGLIWLAIIFGCVVVHELAHSLVARSRGALVREIVLLPIGGVSKLEKLPESPIDELAIAIVGPAASVALAGAAVLVAVGLRQPLFPIDLYGGPLLARLVWFNLIIAGFNLLPAFPLDGGRVFRALLERRYDLERATRLAARVGRALALTLVAVGVFVNLWFLIIGVFVYFGASAEEAATIVHARLRGSSVADVMLLDSVVVAPTASVADLRMLLRRSAQRAFPVVGTQGYEGMIDAAAVEHSPPEHVAADIATRVPLITLTSSLEEEALPLAVKSPVKALAVADAGRVVGLLRVEDIQHLLTDLGYQPTPRAG
jgi:Zn-dependent protease